MTRIRPKAGRIRLDPVSYENLRQQVLWRDGWRCQSCGTMSNLEVHHKEFRSHTGDDSELNLITLCIFCHAQAHGKVASSDSNTTDNSVES
jgi:5-methylcytosine-specific restriction endonuclease McrA